MQRKLGNCKLDELDNLLEDILQAEKEAKQQLDDEYLQEKNKVQKERSAAETVREQALMGMNKRKNDDSNKEKKKKEKG